MSDTDEIRNLLGRYCELLDAADWDGVGALFAEGVLVDAEGRRLAAGREAVASLYRASVLLHAGSPRTKHLVANTVVEPPAPDGSIAARSSYLVLQALDGAPLQPIVTGRYLDRFARGGDGRLRFAERRFFIDLAGDRSRHLAPSQ